MEIDQATQIRQAGGRRLLSKTEQTVGSELMRERARCDIGLCDQKGSNAGGNS